MRNVKHVENFNNVKPVCDVLDSLVNFDHYEKWIKIVRNFKILNYKITENYVVYDEHDII